jgi:hypothetical protein
MDLGNPLEQADRARARLFREGEGECEGNSEGKEQEESLLGHLQ